MHYLPLKWWRLKIIKILKAAREKQRVSYKGIPIRLSADFSKETFQSEGSGNIYSKFWKWKAYNLRYSTHQDYHSE